MRTLDPIERKKLWAQMDDTARKLGVMTMPKLHIGMLVEKDGIVLTNQREEGHSWTRNMWNAIFGTHTHCGGSSATFGAGYISSKRTTGNVAGGTGYSVNLFFTELKTPLADYGFCSSTADSSRGIVVGTDDTAFDIDDYALGAIIAHGNGAGQLSYVGMDKPSLDYTAKVWTASLVRLFNNNSGDTITVKEVGIISRSALFNNSPYDYFLLARDVLGSPVAVANGAQLTVTYEISMDFTSIDT